MSINWVMLDDKKSFVPLPREKILFNSPPRTNLTLQTPNSYPGKEPLSIQCGSGTAFITNQRLVYLPTTPTPSLQSFSAPILNLQDTRVSAPFFGPNVWSGVLQPINGGGIPPHHAFVEIKMSFKDGGAYDFQSSFERVKEVLSNAIEEARESGRVSGRAEDMDMSAVHLEQLPAYEEVGNAPSTPSSNVLRPTPISPIRQQQRTQTGYTNDEHGGDTSIAQPLNQHHFQPPNEPPPGYEETQQSSVVNNLDEAIHRPGH